MHHILLVEDDPDVGTLLEHTLLGAGYHVSRVGTLAAAELLLDDRSHDLLLADMRLPDGCGIDVADKAKARGIKTLLLTGDAFRAAPERLEAHPYVLKPIRPRELLVVIERVLRGVGP
ncbi:MAG TPA: response regulator [Stellaceae bacterium]|nr:response regulator [Stellaceae bacterium]